MDVSDLSSSHRGFMDFSQFSSESSFRGQLDVKISVYSTNSVISLLWFSVRNHFREPLLFFFKERELFLECLSASNKSCLEVLEVLLDISINLRLMELRLRHRDSNLRGARRKSDLQSKTLQLGSAPGGQGGVKVQRVRSCETQLNRKVRAFLSEAFNSRIKGKTGCFMVFLSLSDSFSACFPLLLTELI